ncbi:MAG: hypothetical protein KUG78_05525 [Kangiellaceae bacterium]|nr:hypothetical protein [Kangiellaceae bacterium]
MSRQLTDFLTNLSTDDALVDAFNNDKESTMKAYGVSDKHIELVINKNYGEIQSILGADYTIANNSVIKAFKK